MVRWRAGPAPHQRWWWRELPGAASSPTADRRAEDRSAGAARRPRIAVAISAAVSRDWTARSGSSVQLRGIKQGNDQHRPRSSAMASAVTILSPIGTRRSKSAITPIGKRDVGGPSGWPSRWRDRRPPPAPDQEVDFGAGASTKAGSDDRQRGFLRRSSSPWIACA